MPLPLPDLDDRTFEELLAEARRQIARSAPDWTDLSAGDPGMVLLELFAHLTETMIYRLNRLPEKAFIAFLRLLGVALYPPSAAAVVLRLGRERAENQPVTIPQGTRVTVSRPAGEMEPPVFVTVEAVTIPAGETTVEVAAYHCDLVAGELIGIGSGLPGLTLSLAQPPVIASTGTDLDLVIGVAATAGELTEREPARQFEGQAYRIWREVPNFTNLGEDGHVYVADRMAGTITFAPAVRMPLAAETALTTAAVALAQIPPAGREIRAWYRRGGGPQGNVAANTLTVFKDPIPGLQVTNPRPATGGRAAETLENALVRGPQELHSLERAITARDFEAVALNQGRGAVARARALTRRDVWVHAEPGTVEVLLVPHLPEEARRQISLGALQMAEAELARREIVEALDRRRPLGTSCVVNWARYKIVQVQAEIVVGRQEDEAAVQARVNERLHGMIAPLPTAYSASGWPFGRALRASDVYNIILAEPGVRWVEGAIRFRVTEVPDGEVRTVAADLFQPDTWYAGSGGILYRSLDNGAGWEPAGRFADETIVLVEPHPSQAGYVAVLTDLDKEDGSRLYVSQDCGESWERISQFAFAVEDLAWIRRGQGMLILLATEKGLFELALHGDRVAVQLEVVDKNEKDPGFYAVTAVEEVRGVVSVAAAARSLRGVYLSNDDGQSGTFRLIGLRGEDVRRLAIQREVARALLWAGVTATGGDDEGKGCFRWALSGREDPPEGWQPVAEGWRGGSCRDLAFLGGQVMAATHRSGVLGWDRRSGRWQAPEIDCGLPLREVERVFQPVVTVAANPAGGILIAGGAAGLSLSADGGRQYVPASRRTFTDKVALPQTWLFVSGEHEITVRSEGAG